MAEIGANRTQATFSTDGVMKGTIEVTNSGDYIGISKDNMITSAQGQVSLAFSADICSSKVPFSSFSVIMISNIGCSLPMLGSVITSTPVLCNSALSDILPRGVTYLSGKYRDTNSNK